MSKPVSVIVGLVLAAGTTFGTAGPASARPAYDPNVARVANPANVCKSIPGSVQHAADIFGIEIDTSSFSYTDCVTMLAKGDAFVEPADEFGSPYVQCDKLLQFGLTYPSTLHNGTDEEDMLLPDLIVKNRKQCGSALYGFHTIFTYLFAG